MLNSASRSRSAVGGIDCDFGAASARPRSLPPTTRISGGLWDDCAAGRPRDRANGGGRTCRVFPAAFAIGQHLGAYVVRRTLLWRFVIAARAVKFALKFLARAFLLVRAPGVAR